MQEEMKGLKRIRYFRSLGRTIFRFRIRMRFVLTILISNSNKNRQQTSNI